LPIEQLEKLIANLTFPLVLLGGKEDAITGIQLSEKFPNRVVNLAGKVSLNESAFVLKKSDFIITHDTGLMHIASAFKIPILSIWGNTVPDFGMYPYQATNGSKQFEVADLSCRPCSKIGFQKCPKGHFKCMLQQDVMAIASCANTLWQKKD
jgi:ADP-heptose:LPS heptosyltransferase